MVTTTITLMTTVMRRLLRILGHTATRRIETVRICVNSTAV